MAARTSQPTPSQPCPPPGLGDEIAMLRSVMKLVESHAQEGAKLEDLLKVLDTLGQASTRLATLLKTDRQLLDRSSDTAAALNEALAEVLREMGAEPKQSSA